MVSLATNELIVAPTLQEVCPLTSDMVRQQQHLLSQMQAGDAAFAQVHQQLRLAKLRSDMQAFKEANVGCVFVDFVRWYAPQSWVAEDLSAAAKTLPTVSVADDVSLVWPGHGRVNIEEPADGGLVDGVDPEWLALWASSPPLHAAQQKPLFNVPQEAEKVLHYLETISPAHLLCQMLVVAIASAHFMLAEAATDATELAPVSAAIAKLRRTGEEAIDALRDSAGGGKAGDDGSGHLSAAEGSTTSTVSQSALVACDRFCDETAALELLLSRAASLLCKLPGRVELVERLLGAGEHGQVVVEEPADREALLAMFGSSAVEADEPCLEACEPTKREYVFRCLVRAPGYERASADQTPWPARMYCCVDGEGDHDPVRIALSTSTDWTC